jgi:DNA adenine methylase
VAETFLSKGQVSAATGWTARHVERLAESAALKFRMSESRGRNGKPQREYLLSSLPAEAQMKFIKAGGLARRNAETLPLFAPPPEVKPAPGRVVLPPELEAQAQARYAAIEPLVDFRKRTNGHRPTFRTQDGRAITNLNALASYVAAQQRPSVSTRTIWRWLGCFDEEGYAALPDAPRSDRGQSRFFVEHPKAAVFVQFKYLSEGIHNVRLVHDALCREWAKLEKMGEAPSYPTVRAYLDSLAVPTPVRTLAHEGKQALWSKHSPFILRKAPPAMDWWIADHREFDVLVRNTLFPPHVCYVEVFSGAAWVLFGKPAGMSKSEVLNDLDGELINFWRVVKHRPAEFSEAAGWMLASRELFERSVPLDGIGDEISRAVKFYSVIRLAYGAKRMGSNFGIRREKRPEIQWPELKEEIAKIVARLRQVWIENLPWSRCIATYDRPDSFFYLDPPYRAKGSKSYRHSFTDDDHVALAETLTRVVRGRWMLSYNDDAFIRKLYRRRGLTLGHLDVKYGLQGGSWTPKRELLIRNF